MDNNIIIKAIEISSNRILYKYEVTGECRKYFKPESPFYVEYDIDISSIPPSVAVIPFLVNVLPISWLCDANISIPECDLAFYNSIPNFKKGYIDMYPMLDFRGSLQVEKLIDNDNKEANGSLLFFSGGVDAYSSLITHLAEKPVLMTIYGSDIKNGNDAAWQKVVGHLDETCKEYDLKKVVIKSQFREFLNEGALSKFVIKSGDGWWHGFQHGIGIIGHGAPVAYVLNKKTVYIASSYTLKELESKSCASSPTIDNYVKYVSADVVHDGIEFDRQDKIRRIVKFQKETERNIKLRVCWETDKGNNCCMCEKCWRTLVGIYAEKANPKEFGFGYDDFSSLCKEIYRHKSYLIKHNNFWETITLTLRQNYTTSDIEHNLKWLYKSNPKHVGEPTVWEKFNQTTIIKLKVFIVKCLTKIGFRWKN